MNTTSRISVRTNMMKPRWLTCLIGSMAVLLSGMANAEQLLETRHVKRVFAESSNQGGFYTTEGLSMCPYSIMFINLATEDGRANYATVLTAKSLNWSIVRMDYIIQPSGICSLTGLHVE